MVRKNNGVVQLSAKNGAVKLYSSKYNAKDTTGFPQLCINTYFPEVCRQLKNGKSWRDEPRECTRYLSPFRNYGFQVSGTWTGDWCCGDTQVIGLENLFNALVETPAIQGSNVSWGRHQLNRSHAAFHVLKGFAESAIMQWTHNSDFEGYDGVSFDFSDTDSYFFSDRGTVFDQFVYATMIYLALYTGRAHLVSDKDLKWYYNLEILNEDKKSSYITYPMDILERICEQDELEEFLEGFEEKKRMGMPV